MAVLIHYNNENFSINFEELPHNANAGYLFSLPQIKPRPLCTGMGKCGRCKIQYHSPVPMLTPLEKILLSKEEQEKNIRLACKHPLEDNLELSIFDDLQQNASQFNLQLPENCSYETAVLFIDLGRLQSIILEFLQNLCTELEKTRIAVNEIYLAANPAMTALFLGESTKGLLEAPYYLENKGSTHYHFNKLPPVFIPPQMSAFIGADACAGLAYILQNYPDLDNFLLADLGTNGEFIYYHGGQVYGASVPLGPALEGVGMRCGSAVHGKGENIILSFSLTPFGLSFECKGNAQFICGAAYLSLLNILLSTNCINRQGLFQNNQPEQVSPLAKKLLTRFKEINGEKRLYVTDNLYFCAEDIENILKVKAAFSSAIELFMQKNTIETIFLSGALSAHIPLDILENLGFLPKNSKAKTKIIGNSSLKGLFSYYTDRELIHKVEKISAQAIIIDLTNQDEYNTLYINNMHF